MTASACSTLRTRSSSTSPSFLSAMYETGRTMNRPGEMILTTVTGRGVQPDDDDADVSAGRKPNARCSVPRFGIL